jgi:hypothetical protein
MPQLPASRTRSTRPPVETKVTAASMAAAVAGAVVWAVSTYVFAGAAVPAALVLLINLGVPYLAALLAGYGAPHTWREDAKARATRKPPPPPAPEIGGL